MIHVLQLKLQNQIEVAPPLPRQVPRAQLAVLHPVSLHYQLPENGRCLLIRLFPPVPPFLPKSPSQSKSKKQAPLLVPHLSSKTAHLSANSAPLVSVKKVRVTSRNMSLPFPEVTVPWVSRFAPFALLPFLRCSAAASVVIEGDNAGYWFTMWMKRHWWYKFVLSFCLFFYFILSD